MLHLPFSFSRLRLIVLALKELAHPHAGGAGAPPIPAQWPDPGPAVPEEHPEPETPPAAPQPEPEPNPEPEPVDLAARLDALAARYPEGLAWRTSVVDFLKTIGLESGVRARKDLARELGYPGPIDGPRDGFVEMNNWLHAELMHRLQAGGFALPE